MSTEREQAFFDGVAAHDQPALRDTTGSLRFDVESDREIRHWHVAVAEGRISVSRSAADADAVVCGNEALFDDIVSGRADSETAMLRGELRVVGDAELMLRFQRVFPGPVAPTT